MLRPFHGEWSRIARGSGYALAARIAMAGSRGVGLILISRALGAEGFGDYSLLVAAFAIASSAGTLGIDQAHIYFTGSRLQGVHTTLRNALWLAAILGGLAGALLLSAVVLFRGRIFDTTPFSGALVTALALPGILHHNYLQGIALGRSWFRYYSGVEVAKWLVHVVLLALLAMVGRLTVTTALVSLYAPIVAAGCLHLGVLLWKDRIRPVDYVFGVPDRRSLLQCLGYGARACLLNLTQVLHLRLDVYLVKYFTSTASVGQYALAVNIADVILYGGRSVGLVVFARRSVHRAKDAGFVPVILRCMFFAVGLGALAVYSWREALIRTFFGPEFMACTAAVACRLPGIVAESLSLVVVSDFLGRARTRAPLLVNSIAVIVGLILNVVFVPSRGMVAAAAAFSGASWLRACGLILAHGRLSGTSWRKYVGLQTGAGSSAGETPIPGGHGSLGISN